MQYLKASTPYKRNHLIELSSVGNFMVKISRTEQQKWQLSAVIRSVSSMSANVRFLPKSEAQGESFHERCANMQSSITWSVFLVVSKVYKAISPTASTVSLLDSIRQPKRHSEWTFVRTLSTENHALGDINDTWDWKIIISCYCASDSILLWEASDPRPDWSVTEAISILEQFADSAFRDCLLNTRGVLSSNAG